MTMKAILFRLNSFIPTITYGSSFNKNIVALWEQHGNFYLAYWTLIFLVKHIRLWDKSSSAHLQRRTERKWQLRGGKINVCVCEHPAQPESGGGWGHWCCLCSCECSMCLSVACVAGCVYVYICVVYVCSVYLCLLQTYCQHCYRLNLGPWSCSSLASLKLLYAAQYTFP